MKINWHDYDEKDHVLAWFLLEAMSQAGIDKIGRFESSELNVEIKVNGIEIPIIEPMNFLQDQLDAIKEEGHRNGYREAKYDMKDKFEQLFGLEDDTY